MKSEKLQDALQDLKDKYIEEAATQASDSKTAQKFNTRKILPLAGSLAACTALLIGIGSAALLNRKNDMAAKPETVAALGLPEAGEYSGGSASFAEAKEDGGIAYYGADADGALPEAAAGSEAKSGMGSVSMLHDEFAVGDVDAEGIVNEDSIEHYNSNAAAFVLTAGVWNDNHNWPFFTNLVNSGAIEFPSFGLDPRSRIAVEVTDEAGAPLRAETVTLENADGEILWTAKTDKEGRAYLFYDADDAPAAVSAAGASAEISIDTSSDDAAEGQGSPTMSPSEEIKLTVPSSETTTDGLQVMFVIDTTGSMSDELAYLQKDFSSIAEEAGDGIEWSVNFYRDEGEEYVTKCHSFTEDVSEVQAQINSTYAEGGGDTPEAVTRILTETILENDEWKDEAAKLLFLVFDAPPHDDDQVGKLSETVKRAAELGIRIVPVVASNAERDTELFARALSILTGADYVFLTNDSGVGDSHLEPIIGDYEVELLHDILVRLIEEAR